MLVNGAEIQSTRQKKSDPDYVDVIVGLIDKFAHHGRTEYAAKYATRYMARR
jgi:hypothetical protein